MRKLVLTIVLVLFACSCLVMEGKAEDNFSVEEDVDLGTTQELLDMCSIDKEHPLYTKAVVFCLGFITGAVHYHQAISKGPDMEPIVCPEKPVSRFEFAEVFIEWAKTHPEFMDEPPVEGLFRSAVDKWPCEE